MTRKLHIGGKIRAEGWEIMNAIAAPEVDHVGNANDLTRFPDATFAEIYASHILEHLDYQGELSKALLEWHRVLQPAGRVYISVPDMDTLARMFLEKQLLTRDDRFFVMRMLFGGHTDAYDYHVVGLNEEFLDMFLTQAGFTGIRRVENFGLFEDASTIQFKGMPISVNIIAEKPGRSFSQAVANLFGAGR
jgi:predicted SAM-dependent methyltransferase